MVSQTVYVGESGSIAEGILNGLFCIVEPVLENVGNDKTGRIGRCARKSPKTSVRSNRIVPLKVFETVGLGEYELVGVRNTSLHTIRPSPSRFANSWT